MRELTEVFDGSFVVCESRFFTGLKATKMKFLFGNSDFRTPEICAAAKCDPNVSAGVVLTDTRVGRILRNRGKSKIIPSVIQRCQRVSMVNDGAFRGVHNYAVHGKHSSPSSGSYVCYGVPAPRVRVVSDTPSPLHQKFIEVGIHDGVLASGEWDIAYIGVERLDDGVTLHVVFHVRTPNANVMFSRYFNTKTAATC